MLQATNSTGICWTQNFRFAQVWPNSLMQQQTRSTGCSRSQLKLCFGTVSATLRSAETQLNVPAEQNVSALSSGRSADRGTRTSWSTWQLHCDGRASCILFCSCRKFSPQRCVTRIYRRKSIQLKNKVGCGRATAFVGPMNFWSNSLLFKML